MWVTGSARAQYTWFKMINYQDYDNEFNELNIGKDERLEILRYFETLALIGIEYQQNNELKLELNYD